MTTAYHNEWVQRTEQSKMLFPFTAFVTKLSGLIKTQHIGIIGANAKNWAVYMEWKEDEKGTMDQSLPRF